MLALRKSFSMSKENNSYENKGRVNEPALLFQHQAWRRVVLGRDLRGEEVVEGLLL